ncbi:MAG: TRZ/ATZ family hydrolase [Abyssibacter sp.]|nr:TRZ/ATZ family hydrolase [Abyssibacter sp.]
MEVHTLLTPRWLLPIEPMAVLEGHGLAMDNGRITAIIPPEALDSVQAVEHIDLPDHALLPGLVNAHTHAAMSLMRGMADDLPLQEWLEQHIWPAEGRFASEAFVRDGTQLAMLEMLRGGTTCFADMYFFPDAVAKAVDAAGMRAAVGMILIDFPTAWAKDADEYLSKGLSVRDASRDMPLVTTIFAPHAPYTVSDAPLKRVRTLSDELDLPVQMHVHETRFEVDEALRTTGQRPLQRLDGLGLLKPGFMAVHMTALTDDDIRLCGARGLSVVHCAESNMKLASGQCRVDDLLDHGVNVALGTDGAASNNDLDMFGEMRTAAMLAKLTTQRATAFSAGQALQAATLGGARALNLESVIGSLQPGKSADMIAVSMRQPNTWPVHNVISQLVYACDREQVSDVWVAGQRLLERREAKTLNAPQIMDRAAHWAQRMQEPA